MPFVAEHGERRVIPEEVDDDADLSCPSCGDSMGVRGPFSDGRARHFFHHSEARFGQCNPIGGESAGESDIHRKLKSQAVSALREHYGDEACRCGPEIALDVSETETEPDERRADALVEFHEPNRFYGRGIIVEVQYKNLGKDERGTTYDYLKLGYSVYWATPEDFSEDRFDVEGMEQAFNDGDLAAFSVYHDDPPSLGVPSELPTSEDEIGRYTGFDPIPECDHQFVRDGFSDVTYTCLFCNIGFYIQFFSLRFERFLKMRMYREPEFNEETHTVYDSGHVDRSSTVSSTEIAHIGDERVDHAHVWSEIQGWSGREYVCRHCQSTMTVEGDEICIVNKQVEGEQTS
jgi:hypothetical protein